MMLKVQSVDNAVTYWIDNKGGKILQSRTTDNDDNDTLQSAFIALGNGSTTDHAFSLELVRTTSDCQVGNVLNYIGVSLLQQFQGNLLQEGLPSLGETTTQQQKQQQGVEEPHGIPVKSCAASPGDFLCRVCLKSNDLERTRQFYQEILGMQVAAANDSQLCLRYAATSSPNADDDDNNTAPFGVPTTLVFEGTNEKLNHGTCLDHLAIQTTTSIGALWEQLQQTKGATVYMNPTEMFGMTVMGLRDPNGYKVVLAGPS